MSAGPPASPSAPSDRRVLEALQQVTDAGLARLSAQDLLVELLNRITEILGTDTAAILLLDDDGRVLTARAAKGIEEEVERRVQIPVGGGFAGRIAAERRPIAILDVDHAEILNPILREKGIKSLLGVPLLVEDRVLGVLHIGSLKPREFTADEEGLLQLAADRAAVAIEHAHLYEQQQLAEALQRQILGGELKGAVAGSGLDIASRYLPASGESLGGDWYDAFAVGGGRLAMVVGDVVGHGLGAAAVMAQLRTALRAYAVDGHPPEGVVDRVNRLMLGLGPPTMTTLAFVVFDPEQERVEIVSAGHLPPLVVPLEGEPRFLQTRPGVPLGISHGAAYSCHAEEFPTGSTLVLYTDGLVEVRGEPIDEGLERLRLASAGEPGVEALCDRIAGSLVAANRPDDIAVVAATVPPVPERLEGRWPADPEVLAGVRILLRRWLRARGADEDVIYDIVLAALEACANAVEHAYGPGHGKFEVVAERIDDRVRIAVDDDGEWRPPREENRGRGLPLMRGLMDTVEIERDPGGTTVVLERALAPRR